MTPLKQRYIEDLQLRGLSEATQQAYVSAIRQLAKHYNKSPDTLNEEDLRQYFVYLINTKKAARSTCTIALSAVKFLYEQTLKRDWPTLDFVRPGKAKKLPVVLSQEEVACLLACLYRPHYRACLTTIYACGLRLQEGAQLQVSAIDSDRMLIHVRQGKGASDRYVPLPQRTLEMLREYWASHRHSVWLFPGRGRKGQFLPNATKPLSGRGIQIAFKAALQESGIQKPATVHTLRHSYATHLLEAGVNLRLIQLYLGHRSMQSTAHYTHLTRQAEIQVESAINALVEGLG